MATFHFELVSPERILFSGPVDQVDLPGSEGNLGVLAGHAPLIAMLRPGVLTVTAGGEKTEIVVLGGLAEANPAGLTVLADVAHSMEDIDRATIATMIRDLEEHIRKMEQGNQLDQAIARLDHYKAIDHHMQGSAMH